VGQKTKKPVGSLVGGEQPPAQQKGAREGEVVGRTVAHSWGAGWRAGVLAGGGWIACRLILFCAGRSGMTEEKEHREEEEEEEEEVGQDEEQEEEEEEEEDVTRVFMSTEVNRLECRFYEAMYPEIEDVVMVNVRNVAEMGAYVVLLEYNNIEGMILLSELSR
jgi:hypothetical protein